MKTFICLTICPCLLLVLGLETQLMCLGGRVETSFGPDFLTSFFIKGFDVNLLPNGLAYALFIKEYPKPYEEAMGFIDVRFWKEIINSELDSIVLIKLGS